MAITNKFQAAKAFLPRWAKGILSQPEVTDLDSLRRAVSLELRAAERGENPISAKEYDQLQRFLDKTATL